MKHSSYSGADTHVFHFQKLSAGIVVLRFQSVHRREAPIAGLGEIADTWIFPPVLTLQYRFDSFGPLKPYVGAGVQWIHFSTGAPEPMGSARRAPRSRMRSVSLFKRDWMCRLAMAGTSNGDEGLDQYRCHEANGGRSRGCRCRSRSVDHQCRCRLSLQYGGCVRWARILGAVKVSK